MQENAILVPLVRAAREEEVKVNRVKDTILNTLEPVICKICSDKQASFVKSAKDMINAPDSKAPQHSKTSIDPQHDKEEEAEEQVQLPEGVEKRFQELEKMEEEQARKRKDVKQNIDTQSGPGSRSPSEVIFHCMGLYGIYNH
jgi:hypothetical protein